MNYLIGQRIEQYQIEALLGEGGMGTVYRAIDLRHDQTVAIKVMHHHLAQKAPFLRRFAQEAQITHDFNNPHLIKVYQYSTYQDVPYLVMEYIAGGSLTAYIHQLEWGGKNIALAEVLQITAQVADGLAYAHQRGVVHRDIKPQNIMLRLRHVGDEEYRQAVISDFGVAVMIQEDDEVSTNPFMGSLPYMSPEQCANLPIDGRSDIYSLGILLYQLAAGQLPFKIEAPADIIKHLEETPIPPHFLNPDMPESVEIVIMKALAKRPEDRYQTAAEMAHILRQVDLTKQGTVVQTAHETDERIVTQWIEKRWVAGVDVRKRIDMQQTWTSEGFYRLFVAHQWEEARIVPLVEDKLTIGRHPNNDIVLDDKSVSGQHALLERTKTGWQVRDLGSTNGTYLDHTQLQFDQPLPWQMQQTLRIGSYAMQWQPFGGRRQAVKVANAAWSPPPTTNGKHEPVGLATAGLVAAGVAATAGLTAAATATKPATVTAVPLSTGSSILGVQFATNEITVTPGQDAFTSFTITNHGSTVEDIDLSLIENNQPTTWVNLMETAVKLMPDESKTVQVHIHPPEDETIVAGPHICQIIASADVNESVADLITIQVASFTGFSLDMHPTKLQEKTESRVVIQDRSNFDNKYEIVGLDESDALVFHFEEPQNATLIAFHDQEQEIKIPAGAEGRINFTVRARKRPWFRAPEQAFPFKVRVRTESSEEWQTLDGQLEVQPRIARRVLFAFLGLILLLGLIGFIGYRQIQAENAAKVAQLQEEAAQKDAQLELAQGRVNSVQQQIDDLELLAASSPEDAAVQQQLASLRQELTAAQQEVETAQSEAASARDQLTEAQDQVNVQVPAPIDILLDVNTITENSPIGTTIGFFSALVDESSAVPTRKVAARVQPGSHLQQPVKITYIYTLVSGDTDAFLISKNELKTAVAMDFETKSRYTVGIQVDNGFGGTFNKQFTITVVDVEDTPKLSIQELTVDEDAGTAKVVASMSGVSNSDVTVDFATADGTTVKDEDYSATKGTLTWKAGETGDKTIEIPITDDDLDESDETLSVTLSGAKNANIETATAIVTIADNDNAPTLTITDTDVDEGAGKVTISVSLSGQSDQDVTVSYATTSNTATAGQDYSTATGTLKWSTGDTGEVTFDVTITEDQIDEPDETFDITLSNPTNATLDTSTATVTITDNDDAPTLSAADLTIVEATTGGKAAITVIMAGSSSQDVTVSYATLDDTAISGKDYTGVKDKLTWKAGETGAKTFDVSITDDGIYEPKDEKFQVLLSNPVNASLADDTAVITLTDNDSLPQISIKDVTIDEGASIATISVDLTGGSSLGASVEYATTTATNDTAVANKDYTQLTTPAPLTWGIDEVGVKTFTISILEDKIDEPNETFSVILSKPTNGAISDGVGVVTINDNDNPPTLAITDASINEGDGHVTLSVHLSGGSSSGVTVDFATVGTGSATPNIDYSTVTGGSLTWDVDETDSARTLEVPILEDKIFEADELFNVLLSNPQNGTLTDDTATVTIIDNDPKPTLAIGADVSIDEGGGTLSMTVTMNGGHYQGVSVSWTTVDVTAKDGSDYTGDSGALTWLANETDTSRTINVAVTDDILDEPNETFRITLGTPVNATTTDASATITIVDNDDPPRLSISDITVNETDNSATFVVSLSAVSGLEVSAGYATANGTAVEPGDYEAGNGSVIIPAGVSAGQISVVINDDLLDENAETFAVNLNSPVNATISDGQGIGTIQDNDPKPDMTLTGPAPITEGNVDTTFIVTLSTASGRAVSVDYATSDVTAIAPGDYQAISGTLTIPAGNTTANIPVVIKQDTLYETDETFSLTLTNAPNANITDGQKSATILNDDPKPAVVINDITVDEGAGTVTLTASIASPSGLDASVNYATANGTAISSEDYQATNGTLTIPAGSTSGSIVVDITEDLFDEVDESFFVNLTVPVNATIADPQARVTIQDNDEPPSFSIDNPNRNEGSGSITFAVTLSSTSNLVISVTYATSDDTAVAPGDYIAKSGTLIFPPGTTSQNIVVTLVDDSLDEDPESFFVTLSNPQNAGITDGIGEGGIADNDPSPNLSVNDPAAVPESATSVSFTVQLSAVSGRTVTVDYMTHDGAGANGAVAPGDYTGASGTLTFSPGTTSRTVTVMLNDDTIDEPDNETFTLDLSGASGAGISDAQGVATIQDNDAPPNVLIYDTSANEGDGNASFVVALSSPSSRSITVNYATSNDTATAPADYTAQSGQQLIFSAGTTIQNVQVVLIDDAIDENNEGFFVNLSSATNANITDGQGYGTIIDDDAAPQITIDNVIVNEDIGTTTFTVDLSAASGLNVSVDYTTANGTAIAPGDYTLNTGTLSFSAGTTSRTISVAIINDSIDETDETFFVNLSSPVNATISDGQGNGTILDNDGPTMNIVSSIVVSETIGGITNTAKFTVTLSAISVQDIHVNYATSNGSAHAGTDYVATSGTLTFSAGVTTRVISVPLIKRTGGPTSRSFNLDLSNVDHATLGTSHSTCTIVEE